MRTFLISYDLAHPNRNKHVLATAIMSLGQSWARPLEQTWYVRADTAEMDIESRLAGLLENAPNAPALSRSASRMPRREAPNTTVSLADVVTPPNDIVRDQRSTNVTS